MSSQITTATTVLNDADVAAAEIDRVLNTMIFDSRPVYIGVPTDIAYEPISDKGLQQSLTSELPLNDPSLERKVLVELRSWMETKARPVLIMDGNAVRNHCVKEVNELARLTGFPICVTVMGKGGANEALPNFGGVYSGAGSHPQVKKAVETSDALFWFGSFLSDFNTGEFTAEFDRAALIDFQRFFVKIADQQFDVKMKYLLQALIKDLKETPLKRSTESRLIWEAYPNEHIKFKGPLTQDFLWHTLGDFFEKGDYIIAENGTSSFGSGASKLPEGAFMYNQTIFGSIGYATGAAVGSCQAIKEVQGDYKRGVLVTGEGSFHMTVQAVADMLRFDLKPIIFILNNGGYTVERLIHGRTAEYNDVALYDYSALAQTFGPAHKSQYFGPIKTAEELVALIKNPKVRGNDCFTIIELALDPFDAPFSLLKTGAAVDEFNKRHDQKHPAPRVQG
ncbi:MAG: hypothetical protein M1822_009318 [Bathelium mastoideum]|nr:MAG: hypothetical protein M1822_009318 [Bathelium mastoideum]